MRTLKYMVFLLGALLCGQAFAVTSFNFDSDLQEWGSWGNGSGDFDGSVGHQKNGSMKISTDFGEVQTVHYNWSNLTPGLYKVTAFVRAEDVQPSAEKSSFWHFYDSGSGTEDVFVDLHGSYDWRKVQYTVNVKNKLSIWFRLKSPGQVWIDDLQLQSIQVAQALSIEAAAPLKPSSQIKKTIKGSFKEVTLLDFDRVRKSHPFETILDAKNQRMGKFNSQQYYNLEPRNFLSGNWSEFDRISMDVFNPRKDFVDFYLTLGDGQSVNYWSQLNHKTHLAPGWNRINFALNQFVGERGSHRFNRPLNLNQLKKWFFVVDPNEKWAKQYGFFIDNIKVSRNPIPQAPKNILAFDFTSQKDGQESAFVKVTSRHSYDEKRGFGFLEPQFWRIEDAQWASSHLRYSIGVLKGNFRVKLPNGDYKAQLVMDRLGYWDTSFWRDRTVLANGKPVYKESRPYGRDFLRDWLQFETVVPEADDHPYDLYLKRLFRPIEFTVHVTQGYLDLDFEGDATGISLNSLVIWNKKEEKEARHFLSDIDEWSRKEFDWMARPLNDQKSSSGPRSLLVLVDPSLKLGPKDQVPSVGTSIHLQGGNGEKPFQLMQVSGKGVLSIEVSDLTSDNGKIIPAKSIEFSELIPQFISPDLNHETYFVAGKYLKPIDVKSISLEEGSSKYLWLQLPLSSNLPTGEYHGKLMVKNNNQKSEIEVTINHLNYDLPQIPFQVGFFGPEPISYSYYEGEGLDVLRKKYRLLAIEKLGQDGFTTISGLPEAKLVKEGDDWSLDTSAADEAMTRAMRSGMGKVYFSYGGKFPQQFFDGSLIPAGMSEADFYQRSSKLLKTYLAHKGMPKIVHTFSDEAGGYSNKVSEDLNFGRKLKSIFPFLTLGGFGNKHDPQTRELNKFFEFGFYSNVSKGQLASMGSQWGSYNASPGNLDDPRFTMGPGLYFAQKRGLTHYLEWHASAVNNYPYYDLDGRESDVTMFMPTSDGKLFNTLRYELAVQGLHSLKKLTLLEAALKGKTGPNYAAVRSWLSSLQLGTFSSESNVLQANGRFDFKKFEHELNQHLATLYK